MTRRCWRTSTRFLSLLAALLLGLSACGKSVLDTSTPASDGSLPDEVSTAVTITQYNGDEAVSLLNAKRIDRFYNRRLTKGYQVDLDSINPKTRERNSLKADSAYVDDARNETSAFGNVRLDSSNGSVTSQKMFWDRNTDQITAPGPVTLTRGMDVMRGDNLTTDTKLETAVLEKVSAEGEFGDVYEGW